MAQPRRLAALWRARAGSPAMEFALVAPVMITMMLGVYDITQALIAVRQVTNTAQQVVEIATQMSIQPDGTTNLTPSQAYQAMTAIYATNPRLKGGVDNSAFSVTLSSIVYAMSPANCTPGVNCTYTASVAWSTYLAMGSAATRSCGVVPQVSATTPVTRANLPTAGMTALTSVVVADVSYVYKPLFSNFIVGPITLQRTALLPPRVALKGQYVTYDLANLANPNICRGYL